MFLLGGMLSVQTGSGFTRQTMKNAEYLFCEGIQLNRPCGCVNFDAPPDSNRSSREID